MERSEKEQAEKSGEPEVDPADNPAPRGDQDVDEERLERDLDDLDRAGAN